MSQPDFRKDKFDSTQTNISSMPKVEGGVNPYDPPLPNLNQPIQASDTSIDFKTDSVSENLPSVTSASIIIESKQNSPGFKTFVIFGIVIIVLLYSGVTFLYFKNKNLTGNVENNSSKSLQPIQPPSFNPNLITIDNGSVVYKDPEQGIKILISKDAYPTTGITGFSKVTVSPDRKMLCFEAVAPATKPALYLSDIHGNNVKLIGNNKNGCLWTKDNKSLIYQGKEASGTNTNIFVYDILTGTERNLTEKAILETRPDFTIVGLSSDETHLICSYLTDLDQTLQCQIDLQTGNFTSL